MTNEPAWDPEPGVDEPVDDHPLDDLDLLSELTHPTRARVLRSMKQPRTVADVATLLDMPVTRLYHHVNRLEQLGFIRVVATRRVAAVTERRYQVVAKSFSVAEDLYKTTDRHELAIALGSVFDLAKMQLQREIELGVGLFDDADQQKAILSLGAPHLSVDRRDEMIERLKAVIDEFDSDLDDDDPAAVRTTVFIAAFPETT